MFWLYELSRVCYFIRFGFYAIFSGPNDTHWSSKTKIFVEEIFQFKKSFIIKFRLISDYICSFYIVCGSWLDKQSASQLLVHTYSTNCVRLLVYLLDVISFCYLLTYRLLFTVVWVCGYQYTLLTDDLQRLNWFTFSKQETDCELFTGSMWKEM